MSVPQAIFEHRRPRGSRRCRPGHERAWCLHGRGLHEGASCHHQGSVTAGTICPRTRSDLCTWFLAIRLSAATKKAPSAAELSRQLGVTVRTARLLRRETRPRDGSPRGRVPATRHRRARRGLHRRQVLATGQARTPPAGQDVGRHRHRPVAALVAGRALQLQALDTAQPPRRQPRPPAVQPGRVLLTGSTAAKSARTCSDASSSAATSPPTRRPLRCSRLPEQRGWAYAGISS